VAEAYGAWKRYGERIIYDNRWVRLILVDVEAPNGSRMDYHVVHFDQIAVGMIVDDRDQVLMLWRHRFQTDSWGYELLGGLVEEGETPAEAAAREVEEESGWRSIGEPEHLITFETLPGQVVAPVHVYLWYRAKHVGEPTDTEEVGRLEWVRLDRISDLARRQQIGGSGTLVALLYYLATHDASAGHRGNLVDPAWRHPRTST
jgi:ADP-ribose diphosphatase